MLIDNSLRIATAEAINSQNAGVAAGGLAARGIIGDDSGNLAKEFGGSITDVLRTFASIGDGGGLMLNLTVDTTFASATFGATCEIQLVSMPIVASSLTDATTEGFLTGITGVDLTTGTNVFSGGTGGGTLVAHELPLGTPFYLDNTTTTTTVVDDNIYFARPNSANSFQAHATLASAINNTSVISLDLTGTADVYFVPTVHATTGSLACFDNPSNYTRLTAGQQIQVPIGPLSSLTGQDLLPVGQTIRQPLGTTPTAGVIAATAQRFFYLRYVISNTFSAGAITADIVFDTDVNLNYQPTARVVQ